MKLWGNWYDNNMQQLGPKFCLCVGVFCLCVGLNSRACAFKNQKNNNILQDRFKMEQLRYGYGDFNSSTTSQRPAFIYWKLQDQQCSTNGDKHRRVVDGYQFSMVVWWLWNDRSQLPSTTKPRSQPVWALPFRYPFVVFFGVGTQILPTDLGDVWNSGLRSFGVQAEHWGLGWFFCRFLVIF